MQAPLALAYLLSHSLGHSARCAGLLGLSCRQPESLCTCTRSREWSVLGSCDAGAPATRDVIVHRSACPTQPTSEEGAILAVGDVWQGRPSRTAPNRRPAHGHAYVVKHQVCSWGRGGMCAWST